MKLIKSWVLPFAISAALFLIVRPVLAQTAGLPHDVTVGTVSDESGFRQVYYEFNGSREIITSGRFTSADPITQGGLVAWISQINGLWQIFLYDLSAKVTTQLTFTGNNVNPRIDDVGRIVWEGWDGNTWQIFFFDGKSIRQLTTGDTSLNPDLSGDYISYGRRDITGTWRAVIYSIKDDKSVDVTVGEKARSPQIRNGDIYLGVGSGVEEKFPLTVDDLFLLNLVPLSATSSASPSAVPSPEPTPETVTEEQITEELNASPSASPAETPVQGSGSSGQSEVQ